MDAGTDKLIDLGWGNGWPVGTMPDVVRKCIDARFAGEVHDYRESPGPWTSTTRYRCLTCGYEYLVDHGD